MIGLPFRHWAPIGNVGYRGTALIPRTERGPIDAHTRPDSTGRHIGVRKFGWLAVVALLVPPSQLPQAFGAHAESSLTCQDGLKVNLTQYNTGGTNTVAVSIDSAPVVGSPFTFGCPSTRRSPSRPRPAHTRRQSR